jgi:hypothetical protein
MYFGTKSYLKSNRNHTVKQLEIKYVIDYQYYVNPRSPLSISIHNIVCTAVKKRHYS